MSVLVARLSGFMQSYGDSSLHEVRGTAREPTKSAVVGLLAAAQGRDRSDSVADLASLRLAVRVDQEGQLGRDYQTIGEGGYLRANGKIEQTNSVISPHYYLADAKFLIALEGPHNLLLGLQGALENPYYMPFLGRKAFPPSEPIAFAMNDEDPKPVMHGTLVDAVASWPWLGKVEALRPRMVRVVMDDPYGPEQRRDVPLSFAKRTFAWRTVSVHWIPCPPAPMASNGDVAAQEVL